MLSKEHRLSRSEFLLTKKNGKNFSTPNFSAVVHFHPSTLLPSPSKFCVVTSSKLSKKATVRNHLRRQIYDQLSTLNSQLSINLIIYPKPSMLKLSHAEITAQLNSFLSNFPS